MEYDTKPEKKGQRISTDIKDHYYGVGRPLSKSVWKNRW